MSTFCYGSVCFKVFDADRDGVLCREEIHEMVVALLEVWRDNRTDLIPVSHSLIFNSIIHLIYSFSGYQFILFFFFFTFLAGITYKCA